jgi:putative oxidoreductase
MPFTRSTLLRIIARLLIIGVALVFVVAAGLKALDPAAFAGQIRQYQILPALASVAAWSLIVAEFMLAAALILNLHPRVMPLLAMLLLLGFIAVTAYGMVTGITDGCGCFGALVHRSPWEVIGEDAVMIAVLFAGWLLLRREKPAGGRWKYVWTVGAGLLALALAALSPVLPVDDLTTQLRAGARFDSWPVMHLPVELQKGERVVFLFSTRGDGAAADVARMNTIAQDARVPSAVGLIIDGPEQLTTLMFQFAPAFPVGALEPRFARALYRTLPRTFILRDGTVRRVWTGIPTADEVAAAVTAAGTGR